MDAVKFLKTCKRICDSVDVNDGCSSCIISGNCPVNCDYDINVNKLVEIVEKWSEEHPVKTRQQLFLEKYPNAGIDGEAINICPRIIDQEISIICSFAMPCVECRQRYWNKKVEERK